MMNYWEPKEIPWLSSGEVNKKRLNETDNMISKEGLENSSARWVKENSIMIALAGQGKTRGTVAVNNIPLTTNQSIAAIEPDETLNFEFIFQNLSKRYDELRMMSSGDGTRGGLNKNIIYDVMIAAPIIEEQQKIGVFFKLLDETIAQNGRKVDLLKQLKQSYLQKIFSQELRFAGFSDTWEQRKIEELGDVVRTGINPQNYLKEQFAEYSMPAYDDGQRPQIVLGSSMQSSRLTISGNVLLINKLNVRQKRVWLVSDALENSVASGEFMPFTSSNVDLSFMRQLILSDKTTRDFEAISSGTSNSQKRITPTDFVNYVISIPTSKIEQKRIGDIFDEMDNLITLNQQKLTLLKKQKQAYLQKMFI